MKDYLRLWRLRFYYLNYLLTESAWLQICLGYLGGVATASMQSNPFVLLLIAAALLILRSKSWLIICSIMVGVLLFQNSLASIQNQYDRVQAASTAWVGEVLENRGDSGWQQSVVIEVSGVKILAKFSQYPRMMPGDLVQPVSCLPQKWEARLQQIYWSQGVAAGCSANTWNLLAEGANIREQALELLRRRSNQLYLEPVNSLVRGMLWGEDTGVAEETLDDFRAVGLAHILAVSGFNVSLVVMSILQLAGWLPRRLLIAFSFVSLVVFIWLVGAGNVSALRAGILGGLVLVLQLSGRRAVGAWLLLYACVAMLIWQPLLIWSVSFQLSVAATAGILFLAPAVRKSLAGRRFVPSELMSAAVAATVSTSPVSLVHFGGISLIGLPLNVFVGELISIVTVLGASSMLLPGIGQLLAELNSGLIEGLLGVAKSLADKPFSYTDQPLIGIGYLVCLVATLVAFDYYLLKHADR